MDDSKYISPYRGFAVIMTALVGVPLVLWLIVSALINYYQPQFARLNPDTAQFIGCGMGSVFHLSCAIGGLLTDPWRVLVFRIREFFENLPCGLPFALQCYWEDVRHDGALFVLYASVIGFCLYFTTDGLIGVLALL